MPTPHAEPLDNTGFVALLLKLLEEFPKSDPPTERIQAIAEVTPFAFSEVQAEFRWLQRLGGNTSDNWTGSGLSITRELAIAAELARIESSKPRLPDPHTKQVLEKVKRDLFGPPKPPPPPPKPWRSFSKKKNRRDR